MTLENKLLLEGWQLCPLAEVADIKIGVQGATDRDLAQANGNIPLILSGNLKNTKNIQVSTYTTVERLQEKKLKQEQVLTQERLLLALARRGTAGRVGIFKEAAIHNKATAAIIPKKEIDLNFLFYYFRYQQPVVAQEVERLGKTSITKKHLESLLVPFPSLEDQRQIVDRLDAKLSEVQQGYVLIERTRQYVESAFIIALQDVFAPPKIATWFKCKLGDLVDLIQDMVIPQLTQYGDYPYIDETHIMRERGQLHTRSTWQEQQDSDGREIILLKQAQNVVLYFRSSPKVHLAVLLDVDCALCSTTMAPLRIKEHSQQRLSPEFLLWSVLSEPFQ